MARDAALHYKVGIKGKVEQSRERKEQRPLLHLGVVANEKGAFGSPSTVIAYFTYDVLNRKFPLISCCLEYDEKNDLVYGTEFILPGNNTCIYFLLLLILYTRYFLLISYEKTSYFDGNRFWKQI